MEVDEGEVRIAPDKVVPVSLRDLEHGLVFVGVPDHLSPAEHRTLIDAIHKARTGPAQYVVVTESDARRWGAWRLVPRARYDALLREERPTR